MKKLAIIASAAFATFAFAGGYSGGGDEPQITINGKSTQTVTATSSTFKNKAEEYAYAVQNVSSNGGNVTIDGTSIQSTSAADNSMVHNHAAGYAAYAAQNLASNTGNVDIGKGASSTQRVALRNSIVDNYASAHSKAVQNLATNNGCSACQPEKFHGY